MSAATCGEPLSLALVPSDRVTRLAGLTGEQLAVGLDPLPEDAPVVIRYRLPTPPRTPQELVDDVLDRFETVALGLFPAWLPGAEVIDASSDFDRRVLREMAYGHAATSPHFGPFLADVAEAALRGSHPIRRFEPDVRVDGLTRIIADSYGRDGVAVLVGGDDRRSGDEQSRAAAAFEWLVDRGVAVWLADGVLPLVDRYPTWRLAVPEYLNALATDAHDNRPAPIDYPALAGLPHPASAAE